MAVRPSRFTPLTDERAACGDGQGGEAAGVEFSFAFQPVVDLKHRQVVAREALVRGPAGEGAGLVPAPVHEGHRHRFDQACRVDAVKSAAVLGMRERLAIHFPPHAVHEPGLCIRTTLAAPRTHGFPLARSVVEATEGERLDDGPWCSAIPREYRRCGFPTAIDDFGANHAGLRLRSDFQPDIVKIDVDLTRGIDAHRPRRAIVRHLLGLCEEMGIHVVAEGVETPAERDRLADPGARFLRGGLFARPAFEGLGAVEPAAWPATA
ncbi:MAG: EAL domain-containing protein [Rubrivivax sp.]